MDVMSLRGMAGMLLLLMGGVVAARQPATTPSHIVLGTVLDSREVDAGINVLREAYRRAGITVEVRRYAGDAALRKANAGEVAGDVHRIDGIGETWPNLIQVPVPINYFEIAVYSRNPQLRPRAWRDMKALQLGIVRGVVAVESSTRDLNVRKVDTYDELFRLAASSEIDAIAAPVIVVDEYIKRHGNPAGLVLNNVMDSYLLYHYVNRNYANLVPVIQPILRQMLSDGSIARIRKSTYASAPLAPAGR